MANGVSAEADKRTTAAAVWKRIISPLPSTLVDGATGKLFRPALLTGDDSQTRRQHKHEDSQLATGLLPSQPCAARRKATEDDPPLARSVIRKKVTFQSDPNDRVAKLCQDESLVSYGRKSLSLLMRVGSQRGASRVYHRASKPTLAP